MLWLSSASRIFWCWMSHQRSGSPGDCGGKRNPPAAEQREKYDDPHIQSYFGGIVQDRHGLRIIHQGTLLQEITDEELRERCSERLEITLSSPELAIPVLDRLGIRRYQVMDKEHIYVFERLDESARLNMEFAKAGIPVKGLAVTNEELETYFLNLTGGNAHA